MALVVVIVLLALEAFAIYRVAFSDRVRLLDKALSILAIVAVGAAAIAVGIALTYRFVPRF